MHFFRYDVSLRIRHPNMESDIICKKLGLNVFRRWTAGEQRKTPKGSFLKGIHESTYCCFNLEHPEDTGLADFLKSCCEKFYPHRDFFEQIRLTHGSSEYFIGWYSDRNSGEVFDSELLSRLVELGIDLSIDFYGGAEHSE